MYPVSNLRIFYSKKDSSQQMNALLMSDGLQGRLQGEDYCCLDMFFPLVAAFLDRSIGMSERPMLTTMLTLYLNLLHKVYMGSGKLTWREAEVQAVNSEISNVKKVLVDTFDGHFSTRLSNLKFLLLTHVVEGLRRFDTLSVLDSSPFEIKMCTRRHLII